MRWKNLIGAAAILIVSGTQTKFALAQISRYDQLSATPFKNGYVEKKNTQPLLNELFQRCGPDLSMGTGRAQHVRHEGRFGEDLRQGLQRPADLQERLNAKTLITTPNSDVIYALGYLDFKKTARW